MAINVFFLVVLTSESNSMVALSIYLNFFKIYLFVSRYEVNSMNTHTLQNAG